MHSLGKWKLGLLHRPSHGVGVGSGRSFVALEEENLSASFALKVTRYWFYCCSG